MRAPPKIGIASPRRGRMALDALNFFLADVRGALGPYLNVYLVTQLGWSQSSVGVVTCIGGLLGLGAQTSVERRSTRRRQNAASSSWPWRCWLAVRWRSLQLRTSGRCWP
jgi:hypothetical protein